MKKIVYSQNYKDKITRMRRHLDTQFGTNVRKEIFAKINNRVHSIKNNEYLGISVQEMFGIETEYRYIYAARNYIFYRISDSAIYIVNIYDEREDFMWKLFGIKTTSQETEKYWNE